MRRSESVHVKRYPLHGILISTAFGYDVIFSRRRRYGNPEDRRCKVYKNVSAASMRRYYRASKGWMDAHTTANFEDYSAIPTDKQMEDINQ